MSPESSHNGSKAAGNLAPHWRELRENYPRIAACLALASAALLLADLSLIYQRTEFGREQTALHASIARADLERASATAQAERNVVAAADGLTRRETLMASWLHLAVACDKGVMYLQRDGRVLREMPVQLSPEDSAPRGPDSLRLPALRGVHLVRRVVDGSYPWKVPEAAFLRSGEPVPADRRIPGALGPVAVLLDRGALIYAQPESGPLRYGDYLPPGGVRVAAADLEAIKADLRPGMLVYFY